VKIKHNKSSTILGEIPRDQVINLLHKDYKNRKHRGTLSFEGRRYSILRMKVFAIHGCKCHFCGIEGTKVILTKDFGNGLHCDLYAEVDGGYRLMNRDHILPASLGGKDNVWNMRPTCYKCNSARGNNFDEKDKRQLRQYAVMGAVYRWLHSHRHSDCRLNHNWSYRIAKLIGFVIPRLL
jgi:5-methylcytosine-specific restriction endonuclease McrA